MRVLCHFMSLRVLVDANALPNDLPNDCPTVFQTFGVLSGNMLRHVASYYSATVAPDDFLRNGNVSFRGFVIDAAIFKGHSSPLLSEGGVNRGAFLQALALLPSLR